MKFDTVTIEDKVFINDIAISPGIKQYQYVSTDNDTKVYISMSIYKVAANASNEVISIDTLAGTKETWLWDTSSISSNSLTVKTNSDSDGRAVQPLRALSGDVTSLTVSNSDSVNPKYLGIMKIIISGSNYQLKEEGNVF